MHTLPAAVEQVALNGRTKVAAFYSLKGQISLYRLNGELVWTSPARKQKAPRRMLWSPDGRHLAVVYLDGLLQLFEEHTGRTMQIIAGEDASSICWAHTGDRDQNRDHASSYGDADPRSLHISVPHNFEWRHNLIHAIGTRKSTLKITLDGLLTIGALEFDSTAIQQVLESPSVYTVLSETTIYRVVAERVEANSLVGAAARVQSLAETLAAAATKFAAVQTQFGADLERLIALAEPVTTLYEMVISGFPNREAATWIEEMHESGFKNWVRAADSYYQGVLSLLAEKLVPAVQHLVIYLGDIAGARAATSSSSSSRSRSSSPSPLASSQTLASKIYTALLTLSQGLTEQKHRYISFASVLQTIYRQHLDRNINVIPKEIANEADWIDATEYIRDTIANPAALGLPTADIKDLVARIAEFIEIIKLELKQNLQCRAQHSWPGHELLEACEAGGVYHVLATKDGEYILLQWDQTPDQAPVAHPLGQLQQASFANGRLVVLEPEALCVYTLGIDLVYRHPLEYTGVSFHVNGDLAVILSQDCLHFETVELPRANS